MWWSGGCGIRRRRGWKRGWKSPFPDETDALHSQNTTPIIIDEHIYGVDSYGELRALDLLSGERLWTSDQMTVQARWGAAFMVKYGDRFFVNNDAGFLMIAQFTPEGYVEIDRTRLIERLTEPREFDEYERELGAQLMAKMSPEDIATALVQTLRAEMPAPEELIANTPEARDRAKAERHRPGFEDVTWFRIDIGRRQNAEPRWILPLICRRGHITRNEIGAIRIGQTESWFQVPRAVAGKFADAVQRTASPEDEQDAIAIEEAPEGPRIEARENRRKHGGGGGAGKIHARPAGKGPGGPGGPGKGPGGKLPFKRGKPGGGKPGGGKPGGGGKPFAGKPKFKPKGKPGGPRKD